VTPIRGILGILETMHTQKKIYKKAHTVWEENIYKGIVGELTYHVLFKNKKLNELDLF
jgi:hypothetical protein